jgi:hypothetical protein
MATTETNATKLNPDADRNQQPQSMLPARQNGRWSGYRHLLWARILELKREPEVVFWVFIFPLLLAAGLGIAFRNKPADITSVVVIDGAGARKTLAMLQSASVKNSAVRATVLDRAAALKAFHFGKFDLAIESNPDGSYTYYYDPARPESVLSRAEIDSTLQRTRLALHRLPDPRTAGDELDELRDVGSRFRVGGNAPAQTVEALCSYAHAAQRFPSGPDQQPPYPDGD